MRTLRQVIATISSYRRRRLNLLANARMAEKDGFLLVAKYLRERAKYYRERAKELELDADRIAAYEVSR